MSSSMFPGRAHISWFTSGTLLEAVDDDFSSRLDTPPEWRPLDDGLHNKRHRPREHENAQQLA